MRRTSARSASASARSQSCCAMAWTSPSGARARCSSKPSWPFLPVSRIFRGRLLNSGPILLADPLAVGAAGHVVRPFLVVQVPAHRLADAGFESLGRFPAQLALELTCIDRVAAVVPRTVGHERD